MANENDISAMEREYLSTITSSVSTARTLLLIVALVSVWIIASELLDMVRWEYLRAPFSHYVVRTAWRSLTLSENVPDLKVPFGDLRISDKYLYQQKLGAAGDTIDKDARVVICIKLHGDGPETPREFIEAPSDEAAYEDIMSWCQHYSHFIYSQWTPSPVTLPGGTSLPATHLVGIILERGKVTSGRMPVTTVKAPEISVPVVGLSVSKDDIEIIAGAFLVVAMLWLKFNVRRIEEVVEGAKAQFETDEKRGFLSKWLAGQFLFIRGEDYEVSLAVYLLFLIPYVAMLFSLMEEVGSRLYQTEAYHILTGERGWWRPLSAQIDAYWYTDVLGLLTLRFAILGGALWFLWHQGIEAGRSMMVLSRHIKYGSADEMELCSEFKEDLERALTRRDLGTLRKVGFYLSSVVVVIVLSFYVARWLSVGQSVKEYGWTYAPDFRMAWIPIGLSILMVWLFGKEMREAILIHRENVTFLIRPRLERRSLAQRRETRATEAGPCRDNRGSGGNPESKT